MPDPFEAALEFVLEREGGGRLTDDPQDPGGLTRWGISQRSYPDLDIRMLTRSQANTIYHRDYWTPCHCDSLPAPVALLVFDSAVNQGVGTAVKLLQTALGVTVDGVVGPKTLFAASLQDPLVLARLFQVRRIVHYVESPRWFIYARGWMDRVLLGYQAALALASEAPEA